MKIHRNFGGFDDGDGIGLWHNAASNEKRAMDDGVTYRFADTGLCNSTE
ncbi:hypothetical protein [Streptomyces sp. CB02009]|nr:hypothetical protein [Streptomyces sp. CB02009]